MDGLTVATWCFGLSATLLGWTFVSEVRVQVNATVHLNTHLGWTFAADVVRGWRRWRARGGRY